MVRNQTFEPPRIIQNLGIELSCDILSVSLVNDLTVRSTGQEVQEYDFSKGNTQSFNYEWK